VKKEDNSKLIEFNFRKGMVEEDKSSKTLKHSHVVDFRKKNIFNMVDELVSITKKREDLLEG
jgi:hypothetical protein